MNKISLLDLLIEKNKSIEDRFTSYKQRLTISIASLSVITTIFLFIIKDYLPKIESLYQFSNANILYFIAQISGIVVTSLPIIYIFFLIFRLIWNLFYSFDPVVFQEPDDESLELLKNGNNEEAEKQYIHDLEICYKANIESINKKYTYLNKINNDILSVLLVLMFLFFAIFFLSLCI